MCSLLLGQRSQIGRGPLAGKQPFASPNVEFLVNGFCCSLSNGRGLDGVGTGILTPFVHSVRDALRSQKVAGRPFSRSLGRLC